MTEAARRKRLIEMFDEALLANNMRPTPEFQQDLCSCVPSVGMCPCPYCAIHAALRGGREFVDWLDKQAKS